MDVDLPDAHLDALDALCRGDRISRAEAIRQAVAVHVRHEREQAPDRAFGLVIEWFLRDFRIVELTRPVAREAVAIRKAHRSGCPTRSSGQALAANRHSS